MFGFEIGDRVEPSELGKQCFRSDGRTGTVVGFRTKLRLRSNVDLNRVPLKYAGDRKDGTLECVIVEWDCLMIPQVVHYTYLCHHGIQQGASSPSRYERSERPSKTLIWPKQRAEAEKA